MFSGQLLLFRCCFEPSALLQHLEHYEQLPVHAELCVLSYRAAVPKRRMLCREWRQHKHGFACFCNETSLKLLSPPALPPKGGVMFSGQLLLFRCCFEPSALLQHLEHYEQLPVHAELCVLSYRAAVPKRRMLCREWRQHKHANACGGKGSQESVQEM